MRESQILDDTFERDPIRFPKDKRYRVRAFRYFMYAFVLAIVWTYLKVSYFDNYSPLIDSTDNRNALIGITATRLAQAFYIAFGIFFLVKSIRANERNDGFKIGSMLGFGLFILQMFFYFYKNFTSL